MANLNRSSWGWVGLLGVLAVAGVIGWLFLQSLRKEIARVEPMGTPAGSGRKLLLNQCLMALELPRPLAPAEVGKDDKDFSRLAAAYYHRDGPLGRVLEKYNWFPGPPNTYSADARLPAAVTGLLAAPSGPIPVEAISQLWSESPIAVICLHAHAVASYARPFQWIDFYERNSEVVDLFRPDNAAREFDQLHNAGLRGANIRIIFGNELDSLRAGPERFYRVIVVETSRGRGYFHRYAKSHVTGAALATYDHALAEDGIVCFHTSSRYDDISGDVVTVARNSGWAAVSAADRGDPQQGVHFGSTWVITSRQAERLRFLTAPAPAGQKNRIDWQVR
jgi:hypothetical protein